MQAVAPERHYCEVLAAEMGRDERASLASGRGQIDRDQTDSARGFSEELIMNGFLVFAHPDTHPLGGLSDYLAYVPSLEEAKKKAEDNAAYYSQILDCSTGVVYLKKNSYETWEETPVWFKD